MREGNDDSKDRLSCDSSRADPEILIDYDRSPRLTRTCGCSMRSIGKAPA